MRLVASLCLIAALTSPLLANNWPNWRGPDYNGVASGKGYPTEWSATKNVAWKVELPGRGSSTPVVWGDHIFLTSAADGKNALLAFSRNGKELWRVPIGKDRGGKNPKASGSNPSCVTDGQHVFAYFRSGDLMCVDFAGKLVWQTNLQDKYGEDTLWWDLGTSPVLTKQHCVVAVMQSGPSFLVAFDKTTGQTAWKQDRNVEAPEESAHSYSTPVVLNENGHEMLVVLGADHVTAHDAANGQEVWRVGGLNPDPASQKRLRSIASAVVSDGIVIAPYQRGQEITAIKLGGRGDVTKSHVTWVKKGFWSDVPTPAAVDGKVYVLTDSGKTRGLVTCLDIKTGREIWSGQTEQGRKGFSSSPIVVDGKLYATREDGVTFVLSAGPEFKVLATNELDNTQTVATPVFTDGKILIRTDTHLYCIGGR